MGNKIHYELSKAYYATITMSETGEITYGTPVRIPGTVSINMSPEGELAPFRADGGTYLMSRTNNGYKGDLEIAKIPESFETDCIGVSVHATDKTVIESNTDNVKPFALLFEFAGDAKEIKHVLYYCYADRVAVEGDNPDKREGKAEKLSLTAMPRPDNGMVKVKTGDETTTAVADGWYTEVYEPVISAE